MNFTDAWRHDETTETLWTNPETDIAILAPHAGDIEFNIWCLFRVAVRTAC